jgi:hypothetical protein
MDPRYKIESKPKLRHEKKCGRHDFPTTVFFKKINKKIIVSSVNNLFLDDLSTAGRYVTSSDRYLFVEKEMVLAFFMELKHNLPQNAEVYICR